MPPTHTRVLHDRSSLARLAVGGPSNNQCLPFFNFDLRAVVFDRRQAHALHCKIYCTCNGTVVRVVTAPCAVDCGKQLTAFPSSRVCAREMDFLKGLVDSKKRTLDGPQGGSGPKKWKRRGDVAQEKAAQEVLYAKDMLMLVCNHIHLGQAAADATADALSGRQLAKVTPLRCHRVQSAALG